MNELRLLSDIDTLRDITPVIVSTACIWEVMARKIGNVHPRADFSDTTCLDYLLSSAAFASTYPFDEMGVGRGVMIAVHRTRATVGKNTNLGIILLIAPLIAIRGFMPLTNPPSGTDYDLRAGISKVIESLTEKDSWFTYDAIRLANPGGLGDAPEQDIRNEPTVTLLEAMRLAADRDLIARQYANGFADVFDFGVPAFLAAFEKFRRIEPAIIECQLKWLAEYPDSLVARKNGPAAAEDIRRRVADVMKLGGLDTPEGRRAGVELDRHLRSDGNKLNPGTTADLVTACLFVALRENKVKPADPFRWDVPDWL